MTYIPLSRSRFAEKVQAGQNKASLDVFALVKINADSRRVLHALAMPEYLETWMRPPDTNQIEIHSAHGSRYGFRIDLFPSSESRGCIYWECIFSIPDRIIYLWERHHAGNRARSMVEICLSSHLRGCSLKLKHSGFRNKAETEWHSKMWHSSLKTLCGIMDGVGIPLVSPGLPPFIKPIATTVTNQI